MAQMTPNPEVPMIDDQIELEPNEVEIAAAYLASSPRMRSEHGWRAFDEYCSHEDMKALYTVAREAVLQMGYVLPPIQEPTR